MMKKTNKYGWMAMMMAAVMAVSTPIAARANEMDDEAFEISLDFTDETSMGGQVHDLIPYQAYRVGVLDGKDEKNYFTMMGQNYTQGITAETNDTHVFYNLDGTFSKVSMQVGHLDEGNKESMTMYIYLDGELVRTIDLEPDMIVQNIEIDTTGAQQMYFDIDGTWSGDYGVANIQGIGGHMYKKELSKPVSVSADGEYTFTCLDCGFTKTEAIPKKETCVPYLSPYQTTRATTYEDKEDPSESFSSMGVNWYEGLVLKPSSEALYNLGQKYDSVTFRVGHVDGTERGAGTLKIYADGQFMKEVPVTYNMISEEITLNTQGVIQLKFEFQGSYFPEYAIYDMSYEANCEQQHVFEQEVLVEASNTDTGIMKNTCVNCHASYSEVIPQL